LLCECIFFYFSSPRDAHIMPPKRVSIILID
jgi:hypothetical protein